MTKTVSAYKLRTNLGEHLNDVYYRDNELIIERRGKPLVKIVKIKKMPDAVRDSDPIWDLPNHAVETGNADLATCVDNVLYGK